MREGWKSEQLGEVCQMIKRGIAPKYTDSGGICVINQKCIREHAINLELSRRHNIDAKKVHSERFIKYGDVLVNSTGTGTLGRVAQVRSNPIEPTTVDTHVTIVRPKDGLFHPDFFGYMLIKLEEEIKSSGEGTSGQTELPRTKLASAFTVSFPEDIKEQKRIVAILDEAFAGIATAIANTEKNLANARELFNSSLDHVFSKRKAGWLDIPIGEMADHCLGKMLDKNKNKGTYRPYLRNLNVQWFNVDTSNLLKIRIEEREEDRYRVKKGDLLICEGGYPGRAAIWENDEPIFFQKALHRVRCHEAIYNRWVLYFLYLSNEKKELHKYFTGAGIQHFTGKALKQFKVPVPPKHETSKLLGRYNELHKEVLRLEAVYQQKLTALAELKQSLLQKAFSGELTAEAVKEAAA